MNHKALNSSKGDSLIVHISIGFDLFQAKPWDFSSGFSSFSLKIVDFSLKFSVFFVSWFRICNSILAGTILTSLTWVLLDIEKCYLGLIHFWKKWWIWDCFLGRNQWNQWMWVSDCHILLNGVRAYLYVGLSQYLVHGMWRKACCWAPFMKVMSSYGVEVLQFQVGLIVSTVIMWWMGIKMFWDVRWEGSVNCYWLMGFRMVGWWSSMTFGRCYFCSLFLSNCYQLWLL